MKISTKVKSGMQSLRLRVGFSEKVKCVAPRLSTSVLYSGTLRRVEGIRTKSPRGWLSGGTPLREKDESEGATCRAKINRFEGNGLSSGTVVVKPSEFKGHRTAGARPTL